MNNQTYQSVLLDEYKNPKGLGQVDESFRQSNGINPLCGDEICVGVKLEHDTIIDIKFEARACSICIASGSIMSGLIKDQSVNNIAEFKLQLKNILTNTPQESDTNPLLEAFTIISRKPSRHQCALLPWEALSEAITK